MNVNLHYKTKQFFFVLIKLSIVVGAFYFIYSKITENGNLKFTEFLSFLKTNHSFSIKTVLFLIFLSGFNWFFEILKWQHLVRTIKSISFKSAVIQSLSALTTSLITPNRIGDYGAKAMYYLKPLRTKIVMLNLLGNLAQMTITTFLGCIGFIIFSIRYALDINYYKISRIAIVVLIITIFALFGMKQKRYKIKGFSITTILNFITSIYLKTHITILLLSLIRFAIFSFQFYYLLTVFGININYINAMIVITSMYLLASIVPTISIFDVIIKGSIAVFLFSYLGIDELTILVISTLMWCLNFVIPSVIGSYFVLNFRLPKPITQC
ncbi:flippase-like domain-containing protein [Winogradskyella litoriviva]|uniref:Flippase-like domain-containing protein n=1 Tax=Winogradskyella litoriviva TaxID=1220182 RepID=A0ABX2E1L3_9FLAO|nr:lysylphosphatidylglycerol synthase domain-containing protein [Winogradskyella litoriviva]NRD21861.1 flippase-like domain-containing protein [Winogradskyella litoriviva]